MRWLVLAVLMILIALVLPTLLVKEGDYDAENSGGAATEGVYENWFASALPLGREFNSLWKDNLKAEGAGNTATGPVQLLPEVPVGTGKTPDDATRADGRGLDESLSGASPISVLAAIGPLLPVPQGLSDLQEGTQVHRLICSVPWPCEQAKQVADCESTDKPDVVSPGGHRGLFQIASVHIKRVLAMGYTWDDMLTAGPNVNVAYAIWQEQGWQPWSCKP